MTLTAEMYLQIMVSITTSFRINTVQAVNCDAKSGFFFSKI